jgi:hypothetical protein
VRLARDLVELGARERRKERVALDVGVDLGQHELVRQRQCARVQLGAPDDEDALGALNEVEGLLERARSFRALGAPLRISGDDDVSSTGQRPEPVGQRFPGASPHEDGMARRELAKPLHVLG